MSIVNFGSINLDLVYNVERFVRPGETLRAGDHRRFAGGKGLNQSIALARAGTPPRHVGCVGEDGGWLVETLRKEGVGTRGIRVVRAATGHAVVQVDAVGENCILVHGGANHAISGDQIDRACRDLGPGDWVLLQNETNAVAAVMEKAAAKGSRLAFNPSPFDACLSDLPLDAVDTFLLNQAEAAALSGEGDVPRILDALAERYPKAGIVLTLGARGVAYAEGSLRLEVAAESAAALDTTGAGDTFTGYFLSETYRGSEPLPALQTAGKAAAICVTRLGAADSIPRLSELTPAS